MCGVLVLYAKFDTDLPNRPEFADMSLGALGLLACALAYCRKYETDGIIPRNAPFLLRADAAAAVAELMAAGELSIRDGGGYTVAEYLRSNESKEQIASKRAGNRERKQRERGTQSPPPSPSFDGSSDPLGSRSTSVTRDRTRDITRDIGRDGRVTDGVRPDSDSDLKSLSSGERVQGEGGDSEPLEREDEYRLAYETGVSAGKGGPYAMPRKQAGELHQALLAHAKGGRTGKRLRGERLLEWIRLMAEEFARWLVAEERRRSGMVGFYSSFGPTGFLKWLNEQTQEGAA